MNFCFGDVNNLQLCFQCVYLWPRLASLRGTQKMIDNFISSCRKAGFKVHDLFPVCAAGCLSRSLWAFFKLS